MGPLANGRFNPRRHPDKTQALRHRDLVGLEVACELAGSTPVAFENGADLLACHGVT